LTALRTSVNLIVNCKYQVTTKGDLVSLGGHVLTPIESMPSNVEDLIMSMQRSVPFEKPLGPGLNVQAQYLDPEDTCIRSYGEEKYVSGGCITMATITGATMRLL
jgi:hypothetical protein